MFTWFLRAPPTRINNLSDLCRYKRALQWQMAIWLVCDSMRVAKQSKSRKPTGFLRLFILSSRRKVNDNGQFFHDYSSKLRLDMASLEVSRVLQIKGTKKAMLLKTKEKMQELISQPGFAGCKIKNVCFFCVLMLKV